MEMDKDEAKEYLKRKGIVSPIEKYSKEDEKEIKKVMKEGKIYGDPHCEIIY